MKTKKTVWHYKYWEHQYYNRVLEQIVNFMNENTDYEYINYTIGKAQPNGDGRFIGSVIYKTYE